MFHFPFDKDSVKKSTIEKTIVIPTLNSSLLGLLKRKPPLDYRNNEMYWKQFIDMGSHISQITTAEYEPQSPLALVYSSGTTGASKAILL